MKRKYFGTDGIRGIVPYELTPELSMKVGVAAQKVLGKENKTCLVGCDTRISSDLIKAALTSGIAAGGGDVYDASVLPTPGVSYLTVRYGLGYGGVVSASHNPYEYNGLKFFDSSGMKLADTVEAEIERYMETFNELYEKPDSIGKIFEIEEAAEDYSSHVSSFVRVPVNLKVGFDCANGATSTSCRLFAEKSDINAFFVNTEPDGFNINLNCGATHPDSLAEFVVKNGLDGGFAFDGDGDRVIAVDEHGRILNGDQLMGFLVEYYREKNLLKSDTVVGTVMTNFGLEIKLREMGMNLLRASVGDRYVLEKMLETDSLIGGEDSGHIILLDRARTGDGLAVAATILNILAEHSLKFSDVKSFDPYPACLINVKVRDKSRFKADENLQSLIQEESKRLEGFGRLVVRPSGTEPVIRVMVEASSEDLAKETAQRVARAIEERLG